MQHIKSRKIPIKTRLVKASRKRITNDFLICSKILGKMAINVDKEVVISRDVFQPLINLERLVNKLIQSPMRSLVTFSVAIHDK